MTARAGSHGYIPGKIAVKEGSITSSTALHNTNLPSRSQRAPGTVRFLHVDPGFDWLGIVALFV